MEEAKNIFLILDELRENAKQVDNDGLKAVETCIQCKESKRSGSKSSNIDHVPREQDWIYGRCDHQDSWSYREMCGPE